MFVMQIEENLQLFPEKLSDYVFPVMSCVRTNSVFKEKFSEKANVVMEMLASTHANTVIVLSEQN